MTIEQVAAPLAQALAQKGYESLTAVQDAVLVDGVAGRDLLVSAQTGSGKTVAFGLAVAPEILNRQDVLLYADKPIALAIAPTRELAIQIDLIVAEDRRNRSVLRRVRDQPVWTEAIPRFGVPAVRRTSRASKQRIEQFIQIVCRAAVRAGLEREQKFARFQFFGAFRRAL